MLLCVNGLEREKMKYKICSRLFCISGFFFFFWSFLCFLLYVLSYLCPLVAHFISIYLYVLIFSGFLDMHARYHSYHKYIYKNADSAGIVQKREKHIYMEINESPWNKYHTYIVDKFYIFFCRCYYKTSAQVKRLDYTQ